MTENEQEMITWLRACRDHLAKELENNGFIPNEKKMKRRLAELDKEIEAWKTA